MNTYTLCLSRLVVNKDNPVPNELHYHYEHAAIDLDAEYNTDACMAALEWLNDHVGHVVVLLAGREVGRATNELEFIKRINLAGATVIQD